MDVAQYLGVFLLENGLCYLHGIGNLEVQKKPAYYDEETGNMLPASHEIVFNKKSGSIDDSFANYIANIERVSISNAANQIKEFVHEAKLEMKAGKKVDLPGLGNFYLDNNGEIQFEKDPNLQIKGKPIPFFKISKSAEREDNTIEEIIENTEIRELKAGEELEMKPAKLNWSKITFIILIFVVLAGAVLYFLTQKKEDNAIIESNIEERIESEEINNDQSIMQGEQEESEEIEGTNPDELNQGLQVLLNTYNSPEAAERRSNQLNSYGHKTEMKNIEEGQFGVVLLLEKGNQSEEEVLDSLNVLFGVKSKIYK